MFDMTWSHEFAVVPTTVIDSDASKGDFGACVVKEFAFSDYMTAGLESRWVRWTWALVGILLDIETVEVFPNISVVGGKLCEATHDWAGYRLEPWRRTQSELEIREHFVRSTTFPDFSVVLNLPPAGFGLPF